MDIESAFVVQWSGLFQRATMRIGRVAVRPQRSGVELSRPAYTLPTLPFHSDMACSMGHH